MNNGKWFGGAQSENLTNNKERNALKNVFIRVMETQGFDEVNLPALDYSEKYILNNEYSEAQNHYKAIAPNGEVLALSDDLIAGLISMSTTGIEPKGRLCAFGEEKNFLAENYAKTSEYRFGGIIYGNSGIEEECDVILAGINFAKEIGIEQPKVTISNVNAFKGVLNLYAKREEKLERLKSIMSGRIENDVDYAVSQTLAPYKNVEGGAETVKELAAKIDNKQSIDGLLDIFEICNLLNAYGAEGKIVVKPGYLGAYRHDSGMVFAIEDEKHGVIAYGGRCDCKKGNEDIGCLYIVSNVDNALIAARENGVFDKRQARTITVAVAPTGKALEKAHKVRQDFAQEQLFTRMIYGVDKKEAYALMGKKTAGMVIYIDEDGNILHS